MRVLRFRRERLVLSGIAATLLIGGALYFVPSFNSGTPELPVLQNRLASDSRKPGAVFREGILGNFEIPANQSRQLAGPGAGGRAFLVADEDKERARRTVDEYGINIFVSDRVPLDRDVPDIRHPECKYWHYPTTLPTASVVVVFHNEGLSVIQRTAVSAIKKSPPAYLEEVVLVDDFSDKEDLKEKLELWVKNHESGKIRLVRNKQREGLIRARTLGAKQARGQVVIFLDAHCEVNTNWLPPLLTPISINRYVMTVPIVDGINYDTLEYNSVYSQHKNFRGIFEWGMLYKEKELPKYMATDRKHESEPYKSPTHAGGLFAIDRKFFFELGAYDPGLLIWGGENYELSFKVWQCGGSLEWVPCSRVGHIYRGPRSSTPDPVPVENRKGTFSVLANYRRVAEVWMDEYKEYFYIREPLASKYDMGDISPQLEIRRRLQCKDFKWFMTNVAPDMLEDFPLLPKNQFWGQLQNPPSQLCLDTMSSSTCGVWSCHGAGGNQMFRLNVEGQLGTGENCIDSNDQGIIVERCKLGTVHGPWQFKQDSRALYHKIRQQCLEVDAERKHLSLASCNSDVDRQVWEFQQIRPPPD